jgi:hypothetical protein
MQFMSFPIYGNANLWNSVIGDHLADLTTESALLSRANKLPSLTFVWKRFPKINQDGVDLSCEKI